MYVFVRRSVEGALLAGLVMLLAGCSGQATTGQVTGKVTHNGEAVTGGVVTFAPTGGTVGKPATGEISSDGTYSLSTYEPGDGAAVGRHRVLFAPPVPETPEQPADSDEHQEDVEVEIPYSGLMPKEKEVEVAKGANEINIELVAQ
jgi:hypothetical protein